MRKGFTLIESIMVIVLVSIIFFVFSFYIREVIDAWGMVGGQRQMAVSTRAALNRMMREMKRIKNLGEITIYTTDEVEFVDLDDTTVNFRQVSTNLFRNTSLLLEDLEDPGGLQVLYLDENGTHVTTQDAIRIIQIRLTTTDDGAKYVIESASRIRIE
ncbi:MAG: prepilin-type N-terminal cleavage/methylation domain-containing protein [Candidatus Saganbacteria bacterium]|nr:prepilin-type N-terminal cleavage/methylation domain-containing protein [Candidatus Saganbacteria bacterium]